MNAIKTTSKSNDLETILDIFIHRVECIRRDDLLTVMECLGLRSKTTSRLITRCWRLGLIERSIQNVVPDSLGSVFNRSDSSGMAMTNRCFLHNLAEEQQKAICDSTEILTIGTLGAGLAGITKEVCNFDRLNAYLRLSRSFTRFVHEKGEFHHWKKSVGETIFGKSAIVAVAMAPKTNRPKYVIAPVLSSKQSYMVLLRSFSKLGSDYEIC